MLKGLKATLYAYGILHILLGLIDIVVPDPVGKLYSFGEVTPYVNWMGELVGALFVATGIWITNAARDPLKNIGWVKFALTSSGLVLAVNIHSILAGYVEFRQIILPLIMSAVFVTSLIVFYPWNKNKISRADQFPKIE